MSSKLQKSPGEVSSAIYVYARLARDIRDKIYFISTRVSDVRNKVNFHQRRVCIKVYHDEEQGGSTEEQPDVVRPSSQTRLHGERGALRGNALTFPQGNRGLEVRGESEGVSR